MFQGFFQVGGVGGKKVLGWEKDFGNPYNSVAGGMPLKKNDIENKYGRAKRARNFQE